MNNMAFNYTIDSRGVAYLTFDLAGEKVNKFSAGVMQELESVLDEIKTKAEVKLLVFKSAKKNMFIAGADIQEILTIKTEQDAYDKVQKGQEIFNKLDQLPFPTLAVIDGACVGGGCECVLACDYRIASDNSKTLIGLPEVNLGIIPGWGGTQRLPKLIGLQNALTLILGGKPIPAKKAYKMGLIDEISSTEFIEENSEKLIEKILTSKAKRKSGVRKKLNLMNFILEKTMPGHKLIFNQSRKNVLKKSKGHYPAPLKALEVVEKTFQMNLSDGLKIERQVFSECATTQVSKNLIQVFFNNELLKKDAGQEIPDTSYIPNQAAVLGAGIMGGGIAWLFSKNNIPVRIKDLNWDAIAKGYEAAKKIYLQLKKIRKIKDKGIQTQLSYISSSTEYTGFKKVDYVVEAIIENIDIKKKALSELEQQLTDQAIICSNTSALSIDEMSESLSNPERFIGMHFFNPVNRMPLVEIIPSKHTSDEVLANVVHLTRKMGKTPVIVQNCAGFLVNRILLPYINEAAKVLQETGEAERIDKLIYDFGMPMGPFTLADEVGLDVGFHVAEILEKAYGERMLVAPLLNSLFNEHKLLGKKASKGFFTYNGKDKNYNSEIDGIIKSVQKKESIATIDLDDQTILNRCILTMVNEAALCLEGKVVSSVQHLDMAMIMGTGFPPFRGGLLKYADNLGIKNVVSYLKQYEERFGDRFKPAPLLIKMEAEGSQFYN